MTIFDAGGVLKDRHACPRPRLVLYSRGYHSWVQNTSFYVIIGGNNSDYLPTYPAHELPPNLEYSSVKFLSLEEVHHNLHHVQQLTF